MTDAPRSPEPLDVLEREEQALRRRAEEHEAMQRHREAVERGDAEPPVDVPSQERP